MEERKEKKRKERIKRTWRKGNRNKIEGEKKIRKGKRKRRK